MRRHQLCYEFLQQTPPAKQDICCADWPHWHYWYRWLAVAMISTKLSAVNWATNQSSVETSIQAVHSKSHRKYNEHCCYCKWAYTKLSVRWTCNKSPFLRCVAWCWHPLLIRYDTDTRAGKWSANFSALVRVNLINKLILQKARWCWQTVGDWYDTDIVGWYDKTIEG